MNLKYLTIEPTKQHTISVIWLHGLGANADDFYTLIPYLQNSNKGNIRWIFPNAPDQPVTLNGGLSMPSWFDLYQLEESYGCNLEDLDQISQTIVEMARVQHQQGVKLILVGFSQGGTVALAAGLKAQFEQQVLMLSSAAISDRLETFNPYCRAIDIHHGQFDQVIRPSLAQLTYDKLKLLGYGSATNPLRFQHYPMAHEICPQQISDLSQFFNQLDP